MARLAELGGTPLTMTPAEISRLVVTGNREMDQGSQGWGRQA
jgi:hypothetical protein